MLKINVGQEVRNVLYKNMMTVQTVNKNLVVLTLQRGVTSTARHSINITCRGVTSPACHSVNITCRGVTSPARHAARSHSFVYISTS